MFFKVSCTLEAISSVETSVLAFAFHANLGDLELARTPVMWCGARVPRLHIHGGRYKALAARDVGSRWLAIGWIQVVAVVTVGGMVFEFVDVVVFGRGVQDWGGTAVQGSSGLIIQVLQDSTNVSVSVYGEYRSYYIKRNYVNPIILRMHEDSPCMTVLKLLYTPGELWDIKEGAKTFIFK